MAGADAEALAVMRAETTFVERLRQIYTLARRVAKEVLPEQIARKVE